MKQTNVAVESLGAKIKTYSSCIDSLHEPSNILHPSQSTLWATGQGIPQFVIVSLQDLTLNFKNITQVGFMLWHDYDTNPKEIELWVAETTEQEFVFWARFELQQKKGIQLYEIKPLPPQYIYLKISITQTYGAFQTYLNQVFFMAQGIKQKPKSSKQIMPRQNKKQLDLQDLQSDLNHLVEIDRRISRSKSNKKQQKKLNRMSRQSELQNSRGQYQIGKNQQKLKGEKYPFKAQISKGSLSSNKPGRSIYFRSQDYYQDQDEDSRRMVSNEYQSSSSNPKDSIRHEKARQKVSSQESQEFSHSLQSNNTAMSPSLNLTNTLSQKKNFFSRQAIQAHEKQEDNRRSYKRLIEREKVQHSKKKTKEYSYDGDEPEFSSKRKPKHGIQEQEQLQEQEQIPKIQESQAQEFTNNYIDHTPKYNQLSGQQIQASQHQQSQSEETQNYNAAIMALSKHVVKLQDNMEYIQRKVQVLDLKVTHSHQKIQQSILNKVESQVQEIVDRKLNKMWSLKNIKFVNQLNSGQQSHSKSKQVQQDGSPKKKTQNQPKFNYKKNLTKEFFKSDYYAQQQNMALMRDRTKTKRRSKQKHQNDQSRPQVGKYQEQRAQRRLKGSKSFANITHKPNRAREHNNETVENKPTSAPNQQYIANLLERLNTKLKERQVKLSKMQARSKEKNVNNEKDKRKAYGLKERQNNRRQRCNEVYNNHYY